MLPLAFTEARHLLVIWSSSKDLDISFLTPYHKGIRDKIAASIHMYLMTVFFKAVITKQSEVTNEVLEGTDDICSGHTIQTNKTSVA